MTTNIEGRLVLKVTKQRNAPEANPMRFDLQPHGSSCAVVAAQPEQGVPTKALETLEVLRAIETEGGIAPSVWLKSGVAADRTFYRHVKALLDAGLVRNIGSKDRPRYLPMEGEAHEH